MKKTKEKNTGKTYLICATIILVAMIVCSILCYLGNNGSSVISLETGEERILLDSSEGYLVYFDLGEKGNWVAGSDFEEGMLIVPSGNTIPEPVQGVDFESEGYTLEGWYTDWNYFTKWNFEDDKISNDSIALYAKWTINTYTVKFYNQYTDKGDELLWTTTVPYGSRLYLSGEKESDVDYFEYAGIEPTRVGYEFDTWIPLDGSYTITQDTDFVAKYKDEYIYVFTTNYVSNSGIILSENSIMVKGVDEEFEIKILEIEGYTPQVTSITGIATDEEIESLSQRDYITVEYDHDYGFCNIYIDIYYNAAPSQYTVNHWWQNVDGVNYTLHEFETFDEEVYVGDIVSAEGNYYEGYTIINTSKSNFTTTVTVDGEASINIYYDRDSYYIYYLNTGDSYYEINPVVHGDSIPVVEDPTRTGYTFTGWTWYSSARGGMAIDEPTEMPMNNLYVSAGWEITTATVTLQYYVENANDDGYTNMFSTVIENVTTESYVSEITDLEDTIKAEFQTLKGSDYSYFTYDEEKTKEENNDFEIQVSGDGTTTIRVYYSRNRYTVVFDLNDSSYTTGATMIVNGVAYTSDNPYSFTAKYEQDIVELWPTILNFTTDGGNWPVGSGSSQGGPGGGGSSGSSTTYYLSYWKSPGGGQFATAKMILSTEIAMEADEDGTSTYTASWSSSLSETTLYYFVESFDQESTTTGETRRLYNGVYYDLIEEYTNVINGTNRNAQSIKGLSNVGSESSGTDYYYYYSRSSYTLTFYNVNEIMETYTLAYNQSLEEYADIVPDEYPITTAGEKDYTFIGWYTDQECTIPMTWYTENGTITYTTLTDSLTLYAKWEAPSYKVTYILNAYNAEWTDDSDIYQVEDGNIIEEVEEGTHIDMPSDPTREGYNFLGWYYTTTINGKEVEAEYLFDSSQKIYNDIELRAEWESITEVEYTVRYILAEYDANGNLITNINRYINIVDLADPKVTAGDDGTEVTEEPISIEYNGEGFYLPDEVEKSITLDGGSDENVIYFFYTLEQQIDYTVYYVLYEDFEYERGEIPDESVVLADTKTVTVTTHEGAIVTETAINIHGYTVVNYYIEKEQLISDESRNILYFYYTPDVLIDYYIEWYFMDEDGYYPLDPNVTITEIGSLGAIIDSSNWETFTQPDASYFIGHTFDDYMSDVYLVVSEETYVLEIYFKNATYTVSYELQEGNFEIEPEDLIEIDSDSYYIEVTYPDMAILPDEPVKEGYRFIGWYELSEDGDILIEYTFDEPVTEDTILYAIWIEEEEITITKIWDDDNNRDGIRPEEVTIELYQDGNLYESLTLTEEDIVEDNKLEITLTVDKDRYEEEDSIPSTSKLIKVKTLANSEGGLLNPETVEYVYTVQEDAPEGYVASYDQDTLTVTNTHEPELISKTVTKYWRDNHNADGYRYLDDDGNEIENFTLGVTLYANGDAVGEEVRLSEANQTDATDVDTWTYTWDGLYKHENGEEITYKVLETGCSSLYSTKYVQDKLEIYNAYPPEKDIIVEVIWDDCDDRDGLREEELETVLQVRTGDDDYADYDGDNYEKIQKVSDENDWETTWQYMEKYDDNGDEYEYFARLTDESYNAVIEKGYTVEIVIDEYVDEDNHDTVRYIKIILTYEPETVEKKTLTKVWDDNDNQDGYRPNEIKITLNSSEGEVETIVLSEDNALDGDSNVWTYTWEGDNALYKNYGGGEGLEYSVIEEEIYGYTTTYNIVDEEGNIISVGNSISADEDGNFLITNTHEIEKAEVTVRKIWDDSNNDYNTRPDNITILLNANDEEVDRVELSNSTYWAYTWDELDKYKDGNEIIYTIEETEVPDNYEVTYDQDNFIITDTLVSYRYKIEYYYDDVIDNTKTIEGRDLYGKTITYEDKVIYGYELDYVENDNMVISDNEDDNVIKVYYKKIMTKFEISKLSQGETIEGVIFTIKDADGKTIGTYTTDEDGKIEIDLSYGEYTITEKRTIYGYNLNEDEYKILVNEEGIFKID